MQLARPTRAARLALLVICAGCVLTWCAAASADLADETALAERYAPVVRLVEQPEECGPGEPYIPTDVDVALRRADRRAPRSVEPHRPREDRPDGRRSRRPLRVPPRLPGRPARRRLRLRALGAAPDRGIVADRLRPRRHRPGYPGKLALQYWFFYPFNDFNNTHEGDWEMIQLVFDAADAREALAKRPAKVGYSSHEGAERAAWGDEKLEIVDGTHPVVYPAAGSHANKFTAALYLGSSADAGVGCDDTRRPARRAHARS